MIARLRSTHLIIALALAASPLLAQGGRGAPRNPLAPYLKFDSTFVAITHVNVIDGTGAAPRADQTLVMRNGAITALGSSASTPVPPGAMTIDGTGKSVIPGLVMMHEHLFYSNGNSSYSYVGESFTRLYLAGVNFWADAGATSFKAYMHITRDELRAAAEEAHKRGLKITGHLCSVTFREAAELGIDNLEHAFFVSTDFFPNKQPDVCPGQGPGQQSVANVDPNGEQVKSLIAFLVQKHVALTSTLTVFETFTPGHPLPPGLDVLDPILKDQFERGYQRIQTNATSVYTKLYPKETAMELAFVRAGGLLIAGTDPTGGGGVIPGYSDQRQIELLVEAGFTPLEAIRICTLNGATYMGRQNKIGSLAVGKQADVVLLTGDPAAKISDVRNVEIVFKQGIAFDPQKLIGSVKGRVGLY